MHIQLTGKVEKCEHVSSNQTLCAVSVLSYYKTVFSGSGRPNKNKGLNRRKKGKEVKKGSGWFREWQNSPSCLVLWQRMGATQTAGKADSDTYIMKTPQQLNPTETGRLSKMMLPVDKLAKPVWTTYIFSAELTLLLTHPNHWQTFCYFANKCRNPELRHPLQQCRPFHWPVNRQDRWLQTCFDLSGSKSH